MSRQLRKALRRLTSAPASATATRIMQPKQTRIVSGIQPTGNLHLGNYLGAIRNWVRMQDEGSGECFFFLADLHAISQYQEPAALTRGIREMAAALIACGISIDRSALFRQRDVPAHSEMAWLLNGVARVGWLNRMTQFKDKAGKNREGSSVALYTYPVLQAADVLLYQATHVPVGEDQKQHLELARDIATKFNTDYEVELFTLPEPIIPPAAARIMSLRDGQAKMSKSDPSDMSRINLSDDPDLVAQKVRKAKTDPEPLPEDPAGLEGRPEAKNLVTIYAALADETPAQVLARFAGQGFGAFKPALAELTVETLRPIGTRLAELTSDRAELDRLLKVGADRANEIAAPTLAKAYAAMGL
jgi:tryptophanyl-tRNA synthetase